MRHVQAALLASVMILLPAGFVTAQLMPSPPVLAPQPGLGSELAERVFAAGLGERRAAVIAAEASEFADRMAVIYLDGKTGTDWRNVVSRIHDPSRVAGLLLGALESRMTPLVLSDPRFEPVLRATGVSSAGDGFGLELAARAELTRPDALQAALRRVQVAEVAQSPVLEAVRKLITDTDPVPMQLVARMNRELAFARGFDAAGGFGFPTSLDDVAGDLILKLPELTAEEEMRAEITAFSAFAPLGVATIGKISHTRQALDARALQALLQQAEADVLEQLADESGRAAAQRLEGTSL
ncbi:hypothetical protein [Paracoccus aerodenitrificans]|uniref:hypothetical protein n=1 Tax=Paracoccus aerodenitrificans TaxID=3017781 RepID=UPI0022F002FC|nr:hypothetical protein [Paracoccus aerodenitrificans]WBU65559.1 hypothetical protein PAE61_09125 [Paracoccus aerodenitrificans]